MVVRGRATPSRRLRGEKSLSAPPTSTTVESSILKSPLLMPPYSTLCPADFYEHVGGLGQSVRREIACICRAVQDMPVVSSKIFLDMLKHYRRLADALGTFDDNQP